MKYIFLYFAFLFLFLQGCSDNKDKAYTRSIDSLNRIVDSLEFVIKLQGKQNKNLDGFINENLKELLDTNKENIAEKEAGIKIVELTPFWENRFPGIKIKIKNTGIREITKLNIQTQFIYKIVNEVFSIGAIDLINSKEFALKKDESISTRIVGNCNSSYKNNKIVICRLLIKINNSFSLEKNIEFDSKQWFDDSDTDPYEE